MDKSKCLQVKKQLLADTFALYTKTLNYHWNVRNTKDFFEIHKLLEEHYLEMAEAADTIAESIAMGGDYAPGTFSEFKALTVIKEGDATKNAPEMVKELAKDHRTIIQFAKENEASVDFLTSDLLTTRGLAHNKMAWMLEASIAK